MPEHPPTAIDSAIVQAAKKYLDPQTPPEEKNRLRHKLEPWITVDAQGKETLHVPGA